MIKERDIKKGLKKAENFAKYIDRVDKIIDSKLA